MPGVSSPVENRSCPESTHCCSQYVIRFWRMGHGHVVKTLATKWAVGGVSKSLHDDVIKWKHFPRNWPFVPEIHRSPVNSPHKGQWRGALMFLLICVWINGWVNNREAGDLRRHRGHCDVIIMWGHRFNTGMYAMKQFGHNWYLPCCQCMETCSYVSFIQK